MRRAWRPLALVLILTGALPLVGMERGQAADGPEATGTEVVGSASARVAAAGPFVSGLSLETGFGTSTVDLAGEAARGESTTMSAGAAEFLLGQVVDRPLVPDPTRADSSGPTDAERSVAAPAGPFLRAGHEEAHAGPRRSEAATHLGDLGVGDGAAVVGGSSAAAVGEGDAHSSTAVGELRLGGAASPAVVLSGLQWHARQSAGAPAEASFSIGSARIGGQALAVASPAQIATAIEAANAALAPQGIRLHPPAVTAGADGGRVDPLRIELRDPPVTRAAGAAAYSPVAPTVNSAEDSAAKASGSDARFGQALLAANLTLAMLLGNGGAGLEVGGATASLGRREVPDLGSLFGGSKLPPLPAGTRGEANIGTGDGSDGAPGSTAGLPSGSGGSLFDSATGSGRYGSGPAGAGSDLLGSTSGPGPSAAPEPPADVALGAGGAPGRSRPLGKPGHLPAPLAATALAGGLVIAGADWLARRRTVGLVAGLRAAAGLGAAVTRPVRRRRSLAAAGVAVVTVLALGLAPSRVPLPTGGGGEVAAVSPIPPLVDGGGVTGAVTDTGTGIGSASGGVAGDGPSGSASGPGATAGAAQRRGAAGAGAGSGAGVNGHEGAGPTHGGGSSATGATGGGRTSGTAGPNGAGGLGTVTRGRDCPGGDQQDKNSSYSPPCLDFSGGNGGATSKGVSAETITIAMREPETFDVGQNNQGRITDTPADLKRSILGYVDYFNRVYQMYGRKIQVVFYKAKVPLLAGYSGGNQEEANADALTVGQEIKAFADLTAGAPAYADALVRQGVIGLGTFHMSQSWYQARAPYAWAGLPDCTWLAEQSTEYVVKRLAPFPAKWAGDPTMRVKPRAVGLVVPDSPWYQECADRAEAVYKAAGYHFARRVNYPLDFNQESQTATNVVAQMKAAGVTSVLCLCDPLLPYFATPQANQQNYHPEWLVAGFGGVDTDLVGQFYEQDQWSHALGMSVIGDLRSGYDSESYRAYKAVRTDEPAQLRDIAYFAMLQFVACVQMAGPNLNPKTFEAGCFAYPPRQGEIGLWRFGPGDYTAVSDAREIYWDREATSPWNGRKGRYITTLGGTRFAGAWPAGEPAFPPPK